MPKRFPSKAQENADEYGNEVEQLRGAVARSDEEKQRLEAELVQVKEMLQREVGRADAEGKRNAVIISDYKQICQRLEDDYNTAKASLGDLRTKISECDKCLKHATESTDAACSSAQPQENRVDPILSRAQERVRELELELAQTKLAQVEAECKNQDLVHQLHAAAAELHAARNSWPWLSKTLSSIKEAAANKQRGDASSPGSSVSGVPRRDSAPGEMRHSHSLHGRDSFKEPV